MMSLLEMIDLKGRLGSRDSWRERRAIWIAKQVNAALARDPLLRLELMLILKTFQIDETSKKRKRR